MSTRLSAQATLFLPLLIYLSVFRVAFVFAESPYQVVWGQQIGTTDYDFSHGVAADTLGNVFLEWSFDKPLNGDNSGRFDTAVNRYDFNGNLVWDRTFISTVSETTSDIAVDNLGNAYVAGGTTVETTGRRNSAHLDGFIRKVDDRGLILWERSFGTAGGDGAYSISVTPIGDVFVAGQTNGSLGAPNAGGNDAYVSKFDASGDQEWVKQFGTNLAEVAWSVSGDQLGNVFISGTTFGAIGSTTYGSADTFTIKLDVDGNTLWKQQWGSVSYDQSYAVQADGHGGAYIAGYGLKAFVARYDSSGDLLWISDLDSGPGDSSNNLAIDDAGNVYVIGSTRGTLGAQNFGGVDVFVSKITSSGDLVWTTQFGSEENDVASGLAVDFNRDIYVSGLTWGALAGPHLGGVGDAFLIKLSAAPVPEPGHFATLLFAGACCVRCRRRATC